MKFFVPLVDAAEIEQCYQGFARFVGVPAPGRPEDRIATIDWTRDGRALHAAVGAPLPSSFGPAGEIVLAIFDAGEHYFLCTPSRGGAMGLPLVAPKADSRVTRFDGAA